MPKILARYEELEEAVKKYITKEESLEMIRKAFQFSFDRHGEQVRKSGEPYIHHPIEVAIILTELNAGPRTIAAGLLHDVLEDTSVTRTEMIQEFGEEITDLVDGVTKLGQIKYVSKEQVQAKNHQKMFLAMAKDIRVIIIKLADRLHNMRTLRFMPRQKQISISKETLEIFVPIAHRLGIYMMKSELEDRCLRYIDPDEYYYVAGLITDRQKEREKDIIQMKHEISLLLKEHEVDFEIKGRIKNIFSVHKKMREKNKEFSEIFDLLALRLIVPNDVGCYQTLGLIHSKWKPIPRRFKDYIAMPKPNMYQSLHTTVIGSNGKIFEVQIRTQDMDRIAEFGVAAHWAYKEHLYHGLKEEQLDIQSKLKWYKNMVEYSENSNAEELVDALKDDIFAANVYVFTPGGDVLDFPNGSTPIDFAYRIHSEVGNKTTGAIVNGKIVPLSYKLKTGDVIEIKTLKNSFGPSEGWLKIAQTTHARGKIKQFFNKQNRQQTIDSGKEIAYRALSEKMDDVLELMGSKAYLERFSKQGITTLDDLFYAVGKKLIAPQTLVNKSGKDDVVMSAESILEQYNEDKMHERIKVNKASSTGVVVEGLDNPQVKISKCCNPIPGDEIIGYITKGKGITVHRDDCRNVTESEMERIIEVNWESEIMSKKFEVDLIIASFDRNNLLTEIINVINTQGVTLLAVSANVAKDSNVNIKIKVLIENSIKLNTLVANLKKVKDIYSVERFDK